MYTKKEWSIRKNSSGRTGIYIEKFGFVVFAVSDTGDKDVRKIINENLRLIASAPDLLETCEKVFSLLNNFDKDETNILDYGKLIEILKPVIDKATGK